MADIGYLFGAISPVIKAALGYNQRQVAALGVAKDLGDCVGFLAGSLSAVLPSWAMLLIGFAQNFLGFGWLWLIVTRQAPALPLWMMCVLIYVGTNSETFFNTTALVTCIQNFPKSRGQTVTRNMTTAYQNPINPYGKAKKMTVDIILDFYKIKGATRHGCHDLRSDVTWFVCLAMEIDESHGSSLCLRRVTSWSWRSPTSIRSKSVNDLSSPSCQTHKDDDNNNLEDEDEWQDGKKFDAVATFKILSEVDIAHLS
ncbi:Protein NUCLEAR FUSION DEFECTIVE 4 [Zea mays]|uniref:Protein NUCLEAR FUSION DEFECTIVE 4 n=1 Tax=Zea mays TaxID=4577 RepID=A0A3L6EJP0_MAIZE|nr:Protein NUCLEAR FUSION DEFECTIVE 4 [Zea mays]